MCIPPFLNFLKPSSSKNPTTTDPPPPYRQQHSPQNHSHNNNYEYTFRNGLPVVTPVVRDFSTKQEQEVSGMDDTEGVEKRVVDLDLAGNGMKRVGVDAGWM